MNRTFISYSGSRDERRLLVEALSEHGVTPWRDVESLTVGAGTTEFVLADLATCRAAIVWVDARLLASEYVATVELPAIAAARSGHGLLVIPVFDDMTPSEGSDRLREATGFELGEQNGHVVQPGSDPTVTARAVAARVAEALIARAYSENLPASMRLVTYDDTADMRDTAVLSVDWRHRFSSGAIDEATRADLKEALATVAGLLKARYGPSTLQLAIKSHLPIAAAIGYAFAEPTGYTIRMPRGEEEFHTIRRPDAVEPLVREAFPAGPIDARAAALGVAVSRDVDAGITARVRAGDKYRERLTLKPPKGTARTAVQDANTCAAWAAQIGSTLTELSDRNDIDCIDLYLATPVELAVAIGWWANAVGPLRLMNWLGKTGPYEPLWSLP